MSKKIGITRVPMDFARIGEGWAAFGDIAYLKKLVPGYDAVNFVYVEHDVDEHLGKVRTTFEVHRA